MASRGNARRKIFWTDEDRKRFLMQLRDCLETYDVILYAYVLQHNHYHLLVRTNQPNLPRFMQRLNTSYALYARYKHAQPGHQFQGRYTAKIVEGDRYIVTLSRYIHLNPVKTEYWSGRSERERIERIESYPWSSYPGYVEARETDDFVCYDFLKQFGRSLRVSRKRYRVYVHTCITEDDDQMMQILRASAYAIGSDEFILETEQMLKSRASGKATDMDVAVPRKYVGINEIDELVATEFGIESTDLQSKQRRVSVPRRIAIELAVRFTNEGMRAIGEHYGNMKPSAVTMLRKRLKCEDTGKASPAMKIVYKLARRLADRVM